MLYLMAMTYDDPYSSLRTLLLCWDVCNNRIYDLEANNKYS
jgi:hypothetical protein